MWAWIRSHKTFVAGLLVIAIGLAVCVSAFDRYTNPATLGQRILLTRPLVLAGGLAGVVLGGVIILTSVLAPRWIRLRPLFTVQRVAIAMNILVLLAVIGVGFLYVKTNLNPKGSSQCKSATKAAVRPVWGGGYIRLSYGSLEDRIGSAAESAAESAIAGERRRLAQVQKKTYCRSHWTDPWVWLQGLQGVERRK
jgi:hypothetical protein